MRLCLSQVTDGRHSAFLTEAALAVPVKRHLILIRDFCPISKRVRGLRDRSRYKWCACDDFAPMHAGKAEQFHSVKAWDSWTRSIRTGTLGSLLRHHIRRRRRNILTKRGGSKQRHYY